MSGGLNSLLSYIDNVKRVAGRNLHDLYTDPRNALQKTADNVQRSIAEDPVNTGLNFLSPLGIIKPRGGNWLGSQQGDLSIGLDELKPQAGLSGHDLMALGPDGEKAWADYVGGSHGLGLRDFLDQHYPEKMDQLQVASQALAKWINGPLRKYVMRDMGSPNDPIRDLWDQGITHVDPEMVTNNAHEPPEVVMGRRFNQGFPAKGVAKQPYGESWEHATDSWIIPDKAGNFKPINLDPSDRAWMSKLGPDDVVHRVRGDEWAGSLGFSDLIDEISGGLNRGDIKPSQLTSGNFSVDGAVRYAHAQRTARQAQIEAQQAESAKALLDNDEGRKTVQQLPGGWQWDQITDPDRLTAEAKAANSTWCFADPDIAEDYLREGHQIHLLRNPDGIARVAVDSMPTVSDEYTTFGGGLNYDKFKGAFEKKYGDGSLEKSLQSQGMDREDLDDYGILTGLLQDKPLPEIQGNHLFQVRNPKQTGPIHTPGSDHPTTELEQKHTQDFIRNFLNPTEARDVQNAGLLPKNMLYDALNDKLDSNVPIKMQSNLLTGLENHPHNWLTRPELQDIDPSGILKDFQLDPGWDNE